MPLSYARTRPYAFGGAVYEDDELDRDALQKYLAYFKRAGVDNPMLGAPVQQQLSGYSGRGGSFNQSPYAIKGADNKRAYYKAYEQIRKRELDSGVGDYLKKVNEYGGRPDLKYLSEAAQAYVSPQKRRVSWGAQPKDTQAERLASNLKKKLDSIDRINKELPNAVGTRRDALLRQIKNINSDIQNDASMVKSLTGIDYQDARIDKLRQDIEMAPREMEIKEQATGTRKEQLAETKKQNTFNRWRYAQEVKGKGEAVQNVKSIVDTLPPEDRDLVDQFYRQIERGVDPESVMKQIQSESTKRQSTRKTKEIDEAVKAKEEAYEDAVRRGRGTIDDLTRLTQGLEADYAEIDAMLQASPSDPTIKARHAGIRAKLQKRLEQLRKAEQSQPINELPEFGSEAEALAAIEQGAVPSGSTIIIGGREVLVE